jgi:hypothetical protein
VCVCGKIEVVPNCKSISSLPRAPPPPLRRPLDSAAAAPPPQLHKGRPQVCAGRQQRRPGRQHPGCCRLGCACEEVPPKPRPLLRVQEAEGQADQPPRAPAGQSRCRRGGQLAAKRGKDKSIGTSAALSPPIRLLHSSTWRDRAPAGTGKADNSHHPAHPSQLLARQATHPTHPPARGEQSIKRFKRQLVDAARRIAGPPWLCQQVHLPLQSARQPGSQEREPGGHQAGTRDGRSMQHARQAAGAGLGWRCTASATQLLASLSQPGASPAAALGWRWRAGPGGGAPAAP